MKISRKQKSFDVKPKREAVPFFPDEGALMFGQMPLPSFSMDQFRRPGATRIIVTQAIYYPKSGKKMRILGSAKREDTGEPAKPAPKKFLPAQVVRRQLNK